MIHNSLEISHVSRIVRCDKSCANCGSFCETDIFGLKSVCYFLRLLCYIMYFKFSVKSVARGLQ